MSDEANEIQAVQQVSLDNVKEIQAVHQVLSDGVNSIQQVSMDFVDDDITPSREVGPEKGKVVGEKSGPGITDLQLVPDNGK